MSIEWTRVRLAQWGRYCKHGLPKAWASQSSFMNAMSGGRAYDTARDMPGDLEEVQRAVDFLPSCFRQPILQWYTKDGPLWLKAVRLDMSRETLKRRVRMAEMKIDQYLQEIADVRN